MFRNYQCLKVIFVQFISMSSLSWSATQFVRNISEVWSKESENEFIIQSCQKYCGRIKRDRYIILTLITTYWWCRWNQILAQQRNCTAKKLAVIKSTVTNHFTQIFKSRKVVAWIERTSEKMRILAGCHKLLQHFLRSTLYPNKIMVTVWRFSSKTASWIRVKSSS